MTGATSRVGSGAVPVLPPVQLAAVAASFGSEVLGDPATLVRDAALDSRDVTEGALFFCIAGERADGHLFADEARRAGAVALVVERWLDVPLPQVRVASVREAAGPMCAVVFDRPTRDMTVVGVTGTNGKTTCTYLLEAIFRDAGMAPGLIGTTGARIDGEPVTLARTTPEAPDLFRLLARMRASGVRALALEVSSHALAMRRVDGLVHDVALFTNLSQDHLDFHPTMEDYFAVKARLFTPAHAKRGVINADDGWARRLLTLPAIDLTTYAVERRANVRADEIRVGPDGSSFLVEGVPVRTNLRGAFNVSNVLGALTVARELGLEPHGAARAVEKVREVPGRMEPIEAGQDSLVVVDYAHTPDSIRSVLGAARGLATGRVIVVFGCGGDRDRAKRPLMGAAAASLADLAIVTTDNPRSEDPLEIIEQIVAGASETGGAFVVEPDRRAAIRLAVRQADRGDVVVIAGKGHERFQEVDGELIAFDDAVVAREELAAATGVS